MASLVFETRDVSAWLWPPVTHETQDCKMKRDPHLVHTLVFFFSVSPDILFLTLFKRFLCDKTTEYIVSTHNFKIHQIFMLWSCRLLVSKALLKASHSSHYSLDKCRFCFCGIPPDEGEIPVTMHWTSNICPSQHRIALSSWEMRPVHRVCCPAGRVLFKPSYLGPQSVVKIC